MKVAIYYPPQSLKHVGFPFFSEKPERLGSLRELFTKLKLPITEPPKASREQMLRAHTSSYLEHVEAISNMRPLPAIIANSTSPYVQWYTRISKGSYEAGLYAAGAVCQAVQDTLSGKITRSFCAVRPPGHHAGQEKGEGFCLFSNVAIGALNALSLGAKRVAIIDFDRHHGNGTQDVVSKQSGEKVLFISSYQNGCKYSKSSEESIILKNTVLVPIPEHSYWGTVRAEYLAKVIPALYAFKPDLLLLSAGFDMHISDPLTNIRLEAKDFYDLTKLLVNVANDLCNGRIISVLEGGYNLRALRDCVAFHLQALEI